MSLEPKEEEIQNRPESPPLGLLDPSRIQNPLISTENNMMQAGFVMPEQPRQHWQRTPNMSPANIFQGSGTPGSQRSSTGTPNHQMPGPPPPQQQQFFHENPATPGTAPGPAQYDYQAVQMQQQQQAQMAAAHQFDHYRGHMMGMGHPQYPPGYQAQWQQQQMYARQAAQVAAQQRRVAYPQGAYPQGMPQGPMTPAYPPQPSPATRTTPTQPVTPQRPQYPPGAQPQFAYPPVGGPPQQITPTFSSPAMYRQNAARQQYISPVQGPAQTPGTPHRFAPQTPSGATSSPHFGSGGPDMRSPTLMSPNQQQMLQQQQSQQQQQHTPVLPHQMRPMPLPQQPPPQQQVPQPSGPPQYPYRPQLHHDPNAVAFPVAGGGIAHDPELFFTGCSFMCFDVERLVEDRIDRENLEFAIRVHGGEIETDPSKFAEKAHQITHVILDSCRNPTVRQSLEQRKRIVSMQWIADVLTRQKAEIPWKLAHLPAPFNDNFRPYRGKLFSLSGFDETERPAVNFMVEAMGAKVTPYLRKSNDLLIAKMPCEKVNKAVEWKVPVVNYQWIADSYICGSTVPQERPNVENPRYQLGQPASEVNTMPAVIEMVSNEFAAMIRCWKQAIIVNDQAYEKGRQIRKEANNNAFQFPGLKLATQEPPPSDEEIRNWRARIEDHEKRWKAHEETIKKMETAGVSVTKLQTEKAKMKKPQRRVSVVFGDGFDDETLRILKRKVDFLGGTSSETLAKATHVILMSGRRSLMLLESIIRGKNIMSPNWIVNSYRHKMWLDTFEYMLRDPPIEQKLTYNVIRSVLRARNQQVFEGVEFHVTKFVEPSREEIVKLIELGGGVVHAEKPDPLYLAKCVETEQPYIIISCENDARFLSYLAESKLPIYNVDLVLNAILRQKIQPIPMYRIPIPIVVKSPVFRQPPPYSAPGKAA